MDAHSQLHKCQPASANSCLRTVRACTAAFTLSSIGQIGYSQPNPFGQGSPYLSMALTVEAPTDENVLQSTSYQSKYYVPQCNDESHVQNTLTVCNSSKHQSEKKDKQSGVSCEHDRSIGESIAVAMKHKTAMGEAPFKSTVATQNGFSTLQGETSDEDGISMTIRPPD